MSNNAGSSGWDVRQDVTYVFKTKGGKETEAVLTTLRRETDKGTASTTYWSKSLEDTQGKVTEVKRSTEMYTNSQTNLTKSHIRSQRELHKFNMAVLGVNMSMLGLSFNMQMLGGENEEFVQSIRESIAPIQMMMSFINLSLSMHHMWTMAIWGTHAAMSSLTAAMLGIGLLMATLNAKSLKMRILFGALTAAAFALAAAYTMAAISKSFLLAMQSPWGWAQVAVGLAVAAGAGATLAAIYHSSKAQTRAFAGKIITTPTTIMAGEGAEAIVPLQSPRAMSMGISGPGSGGTVFNGAQFFIMADSPRTLYREVEESVEREQYLRT
jgi:hypothetical protein